MSETIQDLVKNYDIDEHGKQIIRSTRSLFLGGVMGAGKDSALRVLLTESAYRDHYRRVITDTTRPPRANDGVMEQDGVDYHFVTVDQMARQLQHHDLVEVNELIPGRYYGVRVSEFRAARVASKIALGNADINGLRNMRRIAPNSVTTAFIVPPSYDVLVDRLRGRYGDEESFQHAWQSRLEITTIEVLEALRTPDFHFVVNDELARVAGVLHDLAQTRQEQAATDEEGREIATELLGRLLLDPAVVD